MGKEIKKKPEEKGLSSKTKSGEEEKRDVDKKNLAKKVDEINARKSKRQV